MIAAMFRPLRRLQMSVERRTPYIRSQVSDVKGGSCFDEAEAASLTVKQLRRDFLRNKLRPDPNRGLEPHL